MKKWLQLYLLSYLTTQILCLSTIIWCCFYKNDWDLFVSFAWCQIGIPFISLFTMYMLCAATITKYKENENE